MISIALFEPQIPPNTGNIARLAVGLNIELIIVGKPGFSLDDRYLKRAGLDYWEHLKFKQYASLDDLYKENSSSNIILATTKGTTAYYNYKYSPNDVILFGSETKGLPKSFIKQNLDKSITIPMPGKIRSLNLANSAAIVTYHALWQIGYFKDFKYNNNYFTEL
jgi:tRNA (cytidine/uridine-2'-O-)-methyltransferase